ncbi:DUF5627 domain-containing protein [Sphingobacterium bovistauri]|uniref:DUF1735 domain-containing protein n=1 Tax=Sphingobacterium bovistauri TaxID=2781959 RepID=A0ABS7Z7D5_9SPHI|nr:DUF5627 domain-containing protein [Sphingobacterium bovistauri]MCA5004619.1 DUF1735 domain-containing protein [Sphingobacterium bovistauri]
MKSKKSILKLLVLSIIAMTSSCKNSEIVHPDFDYQSVYFANQYPIRTIVLGEDNNFDNTLDNERKVEIKATLGGTRDNTKDIIINYSVDNNLLSNLYFASNGPKLTPLPTNFYSLLSQDIVIPKGEIMGGVQVQLTDAFFNDPLAISNYYVLPIKINNVSNADTVLEDKNFVFYALKFINPWHGNYLRRGIDNMSGSVSRNVIRHKAFVENDEVNILRTKALNQVEFPVQFRDADNGNIFNCTLLLTFNENGNCTITSSSNGYTATGTGQYTTKSEKNSWGNKDRSALYLNYEINYTNINIGSGANARQISGKIVTQDTLVARDRAVVPEYFNPVQK